MSDAEAALLAEKFHHEDLTEVGGGVEGGACTARAGQGSACLLQGRTYRLGALLRGPAAQRSPSLCPLPSARPQLVNYVAFAAMVDPRMDAFDEMVQ